MSTPSYDEVTEELRRTHYVTIGGNVWWNWSCSCGREGTPTTQGYAARGKDRHLTAELRKIHARLTEETP